MYTGQLFYIISFNCICTLMVRFRLCIFSRNSTKKVLLWAWFMLISLLVMGLWLLKVTYARFVHCKGSSCHSNWWLSDGDFWNPSFCLNFLFRILWGRALHFCAIVTEEFQITISTCHPHSRWQWVSMNNNLVLGARQKPSPSWFLFHQLCLS